MYHCYRFIDVWMIAYDYEVLQSKDLFIIEIRDTVEKLPSALTFSSELNDFIMQFLILNPKDRPKCRSICMHPWLAGAFDALLVPKGNNHSHYGQGQGQGYHMGLGPESHKGNLRSCMGSVTHSMMSSNNSSTRVGAFGSALVLGLSNELQRTQPGTPTRMASPTGSCKTRPMGSFSESYAPKYTLPSLNIMSPRESFAPLSPLQCVGEVSIGSEKSPSSSPRALLASQSQVLLHTKGFSGLDSKEKVLLENTYDLGQAVLSAVRCRLDGTP